NLEFRILANRNDDKEAIDEARAYFDKAATAWREFIAKVKVKYPAIEPKGGDKDDAETYQDVAFGDEAGLRALVKKRYPKDNPRDVDAWFDRESQEPRKVQQYRDLVNRAESGHAPPPPGEGRKFTITLKDGEHR